jgi:hypothetical protein
MTQQTLTLPCQRVSPTRIPTRDLVLGGTDSLTLCVTVVECDDPNAAPLELTGGIGGPALSLFVWPGGHGRGYWGGCHDYGWGWPGGAVSGGVAGPGTVLWSATGVVSATVPGTFDVVIPAGAMGGWPLRCRWAVLLDFNGGGGAELLAEGHLHVRPMVSRAITPVIMLTDPNPATLTDPGEAIFLAGAPLP